MSGPWDGWLVRPTTIADVLMRRRVQSRRQEVEVQVQESVRVLPLLNSAWLPAVFQLFRRGPRQVPVIGGGGDCGRTPMPNRSSHLAVT